MALPRLLMRFMDWALNFDDREGVPEAIFEMECMICHAVSELCDNEGETSQLWALKHTGRHPTHREFKLLTETFWRVDPMPGNPFADMGPLRSLPRGASR
ncbi:hypothetical protein WEB32_06695 [Streptomyces netropsis]|uniref:DUF7848 domain-containing protein n=1 Tax=Streptomyces netropsis TaxID=55404 RepID=UPI0030CD9973